MTREQERARLRRRQQKLDARAAQREAEAARTRQAVVVVVAVLAVVALFVFLSARLNGGGTTPAASPSASAPSAPTPSATTKAVAGCSKPPATPTGVKTGALPEAKTAAGKTFVATVSTNCGDIRIELDGAQAPQTVASFVALARRGYWNSSPCHRVTTAGIHVLQCGDPMGGTGPGPGYSFGIENAPKDGSYPAGTVAMARTQDPSSNADQFFIVYRDSQLPTEGGGYSIFGTVTTGLDIVEKIAAAGVADGSGDGTPAAPISILEVAVTEKKA